MEKHSCKTYFSVESDNFNKDEVGKFIVDNLGVVPEWERNRFIIGNNGTYSFDVNDMLSVTLKGLFGKEEKIREMQKLFSVTCVLEIVPFIVAGSQSPSQILSLNKRIIEFLYRSDTAVDLDYYVI